MSELFEDIRKYTLGYVLEDFEPILPGGSSDMYLFGVSPYTSNFEAVRFNVTEINSFVGWKYIQFVWDGTGDGVTSKQLFTEFKTYKIKCEIERHRKRERCEHFKTTVLWAMFNMLLEQKPMQIACDLADDGSQLPLIMTAEDLFQWYNEWIREPGTVFPNYVPADILDMVCDSWVVTMMGGNNAL